MSNPSFSIVIPTIGRQALDKTISSILDQSELPDEIVIWDNSGNASAMSCTRYARHPLIRWSIAKKQLNICDSWNHAAASAEGDFIYILGDDDMLLPEAVFQIKKALNSGAKLIHLENQFIDSNDDPLSQLPENPGDISEISGKDFIAEYCRSNRYNIFLSSLVFPKDAFNKIGGFKSIISNGLAMDVLFNIEMLSVIEKIHVIPEPLWQYRTAVSDWCGAVKRAEDVPHFINQYLAYMEYSAKYFSGTLAASYNDFCRRRVISQMIGVCYPASPWRSAAAIFHRGIPLMERMHILRDIFYMMRHRK